MSEWEALMRAICENPDDDLPRLVMADWYDENGDPARAEHVRLQVRHAELWANPGRAIPAQKGATIAWVDGRSKAEAIRQMAIGEVRQRERQLWAEHGLRWRDELPKFRGVEWFPEFFRGFIERVSVPSDQLLVGRSAAFAVQPIRHLTIRRLVGVPGFSELPLLAGLKTLSIANLLSTDAAVDELLKCGRLDANLLLTCSLGGTRADELRRHFGRRMR